MSADVVQLFPPVGEKDAPVKPRERDRCRHELVELDRNARRVYCRDCGEEVDSFTALDTFAGQWERHQRALEDQQREIRWRRRLIEDLKREERNAKARKRRRDSVPAA